MTSLSRQLRQLAAPQTALLALDKKKPSLLFDPREAANLDRDTVYEIGLSGLEDLEKLDERFTEYRESLFSLSSKQFERSVQTSDVNKKLDEVIEKFLVLLSPYFTLRSSHKALEWLVNRYHIHQFNVDAWVMCVLPFHDTKIFVKAIQLLKIDSEYSKWHWMHSIQRPGIPLPRHTLLNVCARDTGLLKLICNNLEKATKVHSVKSTVLNVFIAFFTSTIVGMLELMNGINEEQLATILPTLIEGLTSKFSDLKAGCYMIIAQLNRKAILSERVAEDLCVSILKGMTKNLTVEAVTLLIVLCNKQNPKTFTIAQVPKSNKSLLQKSEFLLAIGALASCYQVSSFVSLMVGNFLADIRKSSEPEFTKLSTLLVKMVEDVRFVGNDSTVVIKSFVCGYLNEVENLKVNSVAAKNLHKLITSVLDRLEKQYPVDFERALHLAMIENASNDKRKEQIRTLLGASWNVDHTTLFLKLNNTSAEVRLDATESVVKAVRQGMERNMNFAVSSIMERLMDSSPLVVKEVLSLGETLLTILPAKRQFPLLMAALANGQPDSSNEWQPVRLSLIQILCSASYVSSRTEDELVELFVALLPFIAPLKHTDLILTKAIVSSGLTAHSPMLEAVSQVIGPKTKREIEETTSIIIQSVLCHVKPFSNDELNSKLFDQILNRIVDPLTHPTHSLPAVFVVIALVRTGTNSINASRMATRFADVLSRMINVAQINNRAIEDGRLQVNALLLQANRGGVIAIEALVYSAMEVLGVVSIDYNKMAETQWATPMKHDNPDDASLQFLISLFRFLVLGLTSRSASLFQKCLQTFFTRMKKTKARLFFLSLVWNDPNLPDALKLVAFKMGSMFMEQESGQSVWAVQLDSFLVPQLICSLASSNPLLRQHALAVWEVLASTHSAKLKSYSPLIQDIKLAAEEIKIDEEQLKVVMARHLSKKANSQISSSLFDLLPLPDVPDHVKQNLLKALEQVNSVSVLKKLLPVIDNMVSNSEAQLNVNQSHVITMLLERFTPESASILAADEGWNCFQKAMRVSKNFILTSENIVLAPQDVIIEVITKEFFRAIPSLNIKLKVFDELLEIIISTDKTVTARQARRALKRISYDAALLTTLIEFKPQPADTVKMDMKVSELRGRRQRQPSQKPSTSILWTRILALLEMLQIKKEIANVHLLIAPLFELLKNCLDEEEQAPLEYSKQLILSCLLSCCQQLPPGDSVKLASEFNTGLIVQCIRVSNNPQTHHQALLLLSLAAQLFPSHVLHNIMAIFTFMGTSVLRQDDAYSFQVIAKTLESVIPTLIEASKKTAVEPVVTTVIHVFADALPEVPEHRRIPVFDKLLTTLDPETYLWLAPTLILSNMATQGPRLGRGLVKEDEKDRIAPDVEFSLNVCHLYKPQVQLNACIRMIEYLHSLPVEKEEQRRFTSAVNKDMTEGSTPFSLEVNTIRQLCHFKLLMVNFISTLLSSNRLVEQLVELDETEKPSLEKLYQKLVETALEFTQLVSRQVDLPLKMTSAEQGPGSKFFRALLHRCYDVVDRVNSLLPRTMFISVVHSLLSHPIPSIRRRAMELLSAKLQHQSNFFSLASDEKVLLDLIPSLTAIACDQGSTEEVVLNQQTSFFTLKLLCRFMGSSVSSSFRPVLDVVVETISPNTKTSTNVLASAFLCLAELIQNLGVQSLPHLPRYGANLVARLEDMSSIENHDLLLLSVVTAVCKLVETLPQFLVPYLTPILKQICYLSTKQPVAEKLSQLQSRLQNIRHSLATSSVPRSLVNSVTQVYAEVTMIESGSFVPSLSIGPLMSILSESFAAMTSEELAVQLPALTSFFVKALDARTLLSVQQATIGQMNTAEEPVVSALVSLVLKLSEASFRPLFFQLYDWATRMSDTRKERIVTFYNVTMQIAEKLKGLFVVFAAHFIKNAAQVIVDTNFTLKGSLPFSGSHAEGNTLLLLEYVLRCLYRVCLHDNENFINKERFESLMEPLVDQLDNQLGEEEVVKRRVKDLLVPLLAQMAVAASDDYLWKALHYQLLLKTRNNSPHVRLGSLSALSALVEKLGEDYLALLPEAIPFLAELLEDDVHEVEVAAQTTIANMENMLGEPLQKYF